MACNTNQLVFRATTPALDAASVPMLVTNYDCSEIQYIVPIRSYLTSPSIKEYSSNLIYTLSASLDRIITLYNAQLIENRKIIGLQINQRATGIDFRPSTQQLYLLGYGAGGGQLYIADITSSNCEVRLTPVGGPIQTAMGDIVILTGRISMDFNPVTDLLRVVTSTGQNILVNPNTGIATIEANLTKNGVTPNIVAIAHTNNLPTAVNTVLYGIDQTDHTLVRIEPANAGIVTTVGYLGFPFTDVQGFDIQNQDPTLNTDFNVIITAILVLRDISGVYEINLDRGAAHAAGTPLGRALAIRDIALVPVPFDFDVNLLRVTLYKNGSVVYVFKPNDRIFNECIKIPLEAGDVLTATLSMSDGSLLPSSIIVALKFCNCPAVSC